MAGRALAQRFLAAGYDVAGARKAAAPCKRRRPANACTAAATSPVSPTSPVVHAPLCAVLSCAPLPLCPPPLLVVLPPRPLKSASISLCVPYVRQRSMRTICTQSTDATANVEPQCDTSTPPKTLPACGEGSGTGPTKEAVTL